MKLPIFKLILLIVVIFAVWEGIAVYRSLNYWKPSPTPPRLSQNTPPALLQMSLPDLGHRLQPLQQWQGRVLVVNFWATWCEPCKDEMPMLDHMQANWPTSQVQFVGIGVDEREAIVQYLKFQPMRYPMLVGNQETLDVTAAYGNAQSGIPFTLVFSPAGDLVLHKLGRITEPELRNAILTATRVRQS